MIERALLLLSDILVAGWLAVALASWLALRSNLALTRQKGRPGWHHHTVVIVPLTEVTAATGPFLERLLDQDHPRYRVVLSVRAREETAYRIVSGLRLHRRPSVSISIAGSAAGCSQENWNAADGLAHLAREDELVVVAEPCGLPARDWLSTLDWAVMDQNEPIVTGLPLLVPAERNLASFAACSVGLAATGAIRPGRLTVPWRGTLAFTPAIARRIALRARWLGSMTLEGGLTRAAERHGLPIATARAVLLETPWSGGIKDALAFGRREFTTLRHDRPAAFRFALLTAILPVAGAGAMAWGLFSGRIWQGVALVLIAALALVRHRLQRAMVRTVLSDDACRRHAAWLRFHALARPIWWLSLAGSLAAAAVGRRIRIGRRSYEWTAYGGARPVPDRSLASPREMP